MRPQLITSTLFSAIRLHTTSAAATSTCLKTSSSNPALKTLGTCVAARPFTSGTSQDSLVRPQAQTTVSDHNIDIPTTLSAPVNMATPINANSVLDLIKARRTYYALSKDLGAVAAARVDEIVKEALLHVPSSFNSQSNRAVVLFGAEHDKLWDIATEILKGIVPEESWKHTADRLAMFKGGAGTVLFFEDQDVINGFQAKFPMYSDKFPGWAAQSDGMLQHTVWTALEAEGLGANLQHYNPLVDGRVAAQWGLPAAWKLNAQLVFGGRAGEPGKKEFQPVEERFRSFGA